MRSHLLGSPDSFNARDAVGSSSARRSPLAARDYESYEGRENRGGQMFAYFSGSLEHSRRPKDSAIALDRGGIREHACEILDGGEEAWWRIAGALPVQAPGQVSEGLRTAPFGITVSQKVAPPNLAPPTFAPASTAPLRLAPRRLALRRSAPARVAP